MKLGEIVEKAMPQMAKRLVKRALSPELLYKARFMLDFGPQALQGLEEAHYFVHMPKCAGNSITDYMGEHGIATLVLKHNKRHPDYRFPHEVITSEADAFTVVRNPFDRLFSAYTFLKEGGKNKEDWEDNQRLLSRYDSFRDFVLHGLGNPEYRDELLEQIHLMPQTAWIMDEEGNLCVREENILRLEKIDEAFAAYVSRRGHEPASLPKKNQSGSSKVDFRDMYRRDDGTVDQTMVAIVADAYRSDFEAFRYEPKI